MMPGQNTDKTLTGLEIAVVGMAGRFPGANTLDAFWKNLCGGVESVRRYTDEQLRERGVPAALLADPDYVKAEVEFDGAEWFDAAFFGYTPREAERLDPQHRIFLECAWEALEHAGYDTRQWPGTIAIFGGAGANVYLMKHLLPRCDLGAGSGVADLLDLVSGNGAESLCTRVAYKLDLRGPAITVQTACSTSLVAVHLACQSLIANECDMALAGGVTLNLLQNGGYRYQAGAIFSPDGHCRAFDEQADGTLLGSGAGIVALKRLEDALKERDTIYAVIKATAANNDGADKIGFTAPGVNGQAAVIRAAHVLAGVSADSISCVEAHGTGTTLGDPIEVAALTQAFRASTQRQKYCAIGSLKTNVGHLDCAAGVAGLIKTVLALKHRVLPASLHFERPNPKIDFETSPFYVNAATRDWRSDGAPLRAGVSAFGIGGTNVHAVLEEAPPVDASGNSGQSGEGWHILPVSAASAPALKEAVHRLQIHIQEHPEQALGDVAHTLQIGRRAFPCRTAIVANGREWAIQALAQEATQSIQTSAGTPEVAFLFPGGGSQHAHMAEALYRDFPVFREELDLCLAFLRDELGLDVRDCLFPRPGEKAQADAALSRMDTGQPALFAVSYALARLWMRIGVQPAVMLGHSLGEYVAACIAGVFSREDALRIVVARARLQQTMARGAMISVLLPEAEVRPFLDMGCELAAVNGAQMSVLAGTLDQIEAVERALTAQGQIPRRLHVGIAAHSSMTEPVMVALEEAVAAVARHAPRIPFLSNVTGKRITAEEATSPAYWARQLRSTVRFAEGLNEILSQPGRVALEVGPSDALTSLARQHTRAASAAGIWPSQAHAQKHEQNSRQMAQAIAHAWSAGVAIDWNACATNKTPRRVPLPTYPFERKRYWIDSGVADSRGGLDKPARHEDCFYVPSWVRAEPVAMPVEADTAGCVLLLGDPGGIAERLADDIRTQGKSLVFAGRGQRFSKAGENHYALRRDSREDFGRLLHEIENDVGPVTTVVHAWSLDAADANLDDRDLLEQGYFSVLALVQALEDVHGADGGGRKFSIHVLTNRTVEVTGEETLRSVKATLLGLCKVIGQEYPHISSRVMDAGLPGSEHAESVLRRHIVAEILRPSENFLTAYRGGHRWLRTYEAKHKDGVSRQRLRENGVYLITGGLGGVGLAIATYLARHWRARLALVGRSALPERDQWETLAADPGQPFALRYRLQQLLELERMGADVLPLHADITDARQLQEALESVSHRFGAINGVIHAAGDNAGGMLSGKTRETVERVFAAKVRGAQVLMAAIQDKPLDFVLFCSSISSIAGGLGMGDYAAANAHLDALAEISRRAARFPVFSVNWDAWRDIGMAAGMQVPDEIGMNAEEGAEAFASIVNGADLPQIIVCTTDLATRLAALDQGMLQTLATMLVDEAASTCQNTCQTQPRPVLGTEYVAPESALEQKLARIWEQQLGIAPIGIYDNLYELGGNSLIAVQILAKARTELKCNVPPSGFFRNLTIGGLAGLMRRDADTPDAARVSGVELTPVPRLEHVQRPAPTQRRIWVFDRLSASNAEARAAYNESVVFSLAGALDRGALQGTLDYILARHEILRTNYVEDEQGDPVAVVSEQATLPIQAYDLEAVPTEAAQRCFREIHAATIGKAFDLAHGLLARAALVRLNEVEHTLIVTIHHIVFDGWSTGVFAREFCAIYPALRAGREPALSPLPIQYADYAAWHERVLADGQEANARFWRQYLEDAPKLSVFPHDYPRPPSPRHFGAAAQFRLDAALARQLTGLARTCEVSAFTLLLSAFLLLLHRQTATPDVVIGTDVAGRGHPDLENLIGFFVNVVPIRSRLDDMVMPFRHWIRALHENVSSVFDHQDTPLDQIMTLANVAREKGASPLLQMLFVMQNTPRGRFDIEGLEIDMLPQAPTSSKFDMAVFVHEKETGFSVDWVYSTERYEHDTAVALAHAWLDILHFLCAATKDTTLSDVLSSGCQLMTTAAHATPLPASKLDKLKVIAERSPVRARNTIEASFPSPGRKFPLLIESFDQDVDPVWWAGQQRDDLENLLRVHAGIVFRGFGLETPQDFERFSEAMEPGLYGAYGDLPKEEEGVNTYHSTPYPQEQMILYHNECAHTDRWPRKQWFFCALPSVVGGVTPIVDCREMLTRLPVEIAEEMARKELLYVRNFHPRLDVSWQHFFKTDSRAEVEARLARGGIQWKWLEGDILQTRTTAPAVITHPLTGERSFFNQVQLHHIHCLEPEVRKDLLEMVGIELMPRHVYFGDGSPIPDATMDIIGETYEACAVRLGWQRGDVVMLDNMLAAHARDPYEEPRKIVVAMGAMYERGQDGKMFLMRA
jgi:acyl transferase domain-containing protein